MTDQVIPADKKFRNLAILGLLLLVVVALFLIQFLQGYLGELKALVETQPEMALARARRLLIGVTLLHALFSCSFGAYFLATGVRAWNAQRYPLEGQRVIRDTRLRVGKSARIAAGIHFLIGALLLLSNALMIRLTFLLSSSIR